MISASPADNSRGGSSVAVRSARVFETFMPAAKRSPSRSARTSRDTSAPRYVQLAQRIAREIDAAIAGVLERGQYISGPEVAEFEKRRAELEAAQAAALSSAQEKGAKLDGLMVQVTQKAGVDGRLFGSVTTVDIAEALKAQGFEVERSMVRLPQGPLKTVGDHDVQIALHTDVAVAIKVSVLGEQVA